MTIIDLTIQECIRIVKDHDIGFKRSIPWRKSGLHALQHGLRVAAISEDIAGAYGLTDQENEILKVICILHDVGYIQTYKEHGIASAKLVNDFLEKHFDDDKRIFIKNILEHHSDKSSNVTGSVIETIMKDADIIDEYGVQSLMMSSQWLDQETPFFYRALEERLLTKEVPFGEKVYQALKTSEGKRIFKKKMTFIHQLHDQLNCENKGSLDYETYLTHLNGDLSC